MPSSSDFYPRSPCGERPTANKALQKVEISIHALLAESDGALKHVHQTEEISIHALLAESDHSLNLPSKPIDKFLSTLSLRRATPVCALRVTSKTHFYPRSPCGERHADYWTPVFTLQFLSTLSLRRATNDLVASSKAKSISIHALLAESDCLIHSKHS